MDISCDRLAEATDGQSGWLGRSEIHAPVPPHGGGVPVGATAGLTTYYFPIHSDDAPAEGRPISNWLSGWLASWMAGWLPGWSRNVLSVSNRCTQENLLRAILGRQIKGILP